MTYRWSARFEFNLQDAWFGVFWKRAAWNVDIWICLLPCVPLHISRRLHSVEHG